jgi:hypothetical protein
MQKYDLTSRGIQQLFKKLLETNLLTKAEVEERTPLAERSIALEVFRCPACRLPQLHKFDECPQCGIVVSKFGGFAKEPAVSDQSPALSKTMTTVVSTPAPDDPSTLDILPNSAEVDTSQWMEYDRDREDELMPTPTPMAVPVTTRKGFIKITVNIKMDLLSRINELDGDLSEVVTTALERYLASEEPRS